MEESHGKTGRKGGMFDLSGTVALITGGAIGLGKAFGEVLAEYGADIAIVDIDEATARETAAQIEKMGRRSCVVKADVTRPDEVRHMVEVLIEDFGYDELAKPVVKPLDGIKFAGYVGCQTNRPFGIAGESFENPKYLDKLVETVGGEAAGDYEQKVTCCGGAMVAGCRFAENVTPRRSVSVACS